MFIQIKMIQKEIEVKYCDNHHRQLLNNFLNAKRSSKKFKNLLDMGRLVIQKPELQEDFVKILTLYTKFMDKTEQKLLRYQTLDKLQDIDKTKTNRRDIVHSYWSELDKSSSYSIAIQILSSKEALKRYTYGFNGGVLFTPEISNGSFGFYDDLKCLERLDPKVLNYGLLSEVFKPNYPSHNIFTFRHRENILKSHGFSSDSEVSLMILLLNLSHQAKEDMICPIIKKIDSYSEGANIIFKEPISESKQKVLTDLIIGEKIPNEEYYENPLKYKLLLGTEYYRGLIDRINRNIEKLASNFGNDADKFITSIKNIVFIRTSGVLEGQRVSKLWDMLIKPLESYDFERAINVAEEMFKNNPALTPLFHYNRLHEFTEEYKRRKQRDEELAELREREKSINELTFLADENYRKMPQELIQHLGKMFILPNGDNFLILPPNKKTNLTRTNFVTIKKVNKEGTFCYSRGLYTYDHAIELINGYNKIEGTCAIQFMHSEDKLVWKHVDATN